MGEHHHGLRVDPRLVTKRQAVHLLQRARAALHDTRRDLAAQREANEELRTENRRLSHEVDRLVDELARLDHQMAQRPTVEQLDRAHRRAAELAARLDAAGLPVDDHT